MSSHVMSNKVHDILFQNVPVKLRDVDLVSTFISDLKNYLMGRTLTIIDGCISDPEQRKAIKDLVRDAFWSQEGYTKSIENIVEGKPPYEENYKNLPIGSSLK